MASRVWLTAVHGSITFHTDVLSQQQVQAWSYTMLSAQTAVRAKTTDTTSDLYFTEMASHMNRYGWGTVSQGQVDLQYNPQNPPALADLLQQSLVELSSVDQSEVELLERILDAFRTPSIAMLQFLMSWWTQIQVSTQQAEFAMGPLRLVDGRPDTALLHYSLRLDLASPGFPQLLLRQAPSASFELKARHMHLQLDMAAYDRLQKQLADEIKDQISGHVATVQLSD